MAGTNCLSATLKGGIGGGVIGVGLGLAGVYGATLRYPAFRSLTLPLKAFLVTSSGTFAGKVTHTVTSLRVQGFRLDDKKQIC